MTAGGGAPLAPVVAVAAVLVPLSATSETATAMTTTSASRARAEGIRPKLICLGAAWVEADISFLREWGPGRRPSWSAPRRSGSTGWLLGSAGAVVAAAGAVARSAAE